MNDWITYVKAIHIISVVTWFSGLFYIVRLFIYHTEAEQKDPVEKEILQAQFKIMEKRLWYGITWPSMIVVIGTGTALVYAFNYWTMPWMSLKFGFVAGLVLYHLRCGKIFGNLQNDLIVMSSFKLRMWNEVATLFLVVIVFVVVLKSTLNWIWGLVGVLLFAAILMLAIRIYKKQRENNQK